MGDVSHDPADLSTLNSGLIKRMFLRYVYSIDTTAMLFKHRNDYFCVF